jgi:glycosyltransferase involved in cell wall biosynthesis
LDKERKVLVFFDFVTHFGGGQRSTVSLCKALKQFYDVHVIDAYGSCDNYTDALADIGITARVLMPDSETVYIGYKDKRFRRTLRLTNQLPALLKLRKRLVKQILQLNPDLIWTNSVKSLFFLSSTLHLRKYPIALYTRGWYQESQLPWYARLLIKYQTDLLLAVSNQTKKALINWGVNEDKIHVVFTTIDFDKVLEDAFREPAMPAPGDGKRYKILVPASLIRTKGQHTAIMAAALLKQKKLDFVMWLAGDVGEGGKFEYVDYLKELISDNGLEETVFLLGWRSDITTLMRMADVVVLPTHTEGLPRTIQEAMILERPVISTAVGGIPELIIHSETGLLVPMEDEHSLAQSVEKLMLDGALSTVLAANGRRCMYENFSTDKHIALVREAFEWGILQQRKEKAVN